MITVSLSTCLGELLAVVAVRHLLVPLPAAQIWSLYLITA